LAAKTDSSGSTDDDHALLLMRAYRPEVDIVLMYLAVQHKGNEAPCCWPHCLF